MMRRISEGNRPIVVSFEVVSLDFWEDDEYIAILYEQKIDSNRRLSVERKDGRGDIPWDELQRIKNECLGEDVWCVENYPAQDSCVNIKNVRHLFICDEPPELRFPMEAVVSDGEIAKLIDAVKAAFL